MSNHTPEGIQPTSLQQDELNWLKASAGYLYQLVAQGEHFDSMQAKLDRGGCTISSGTYDYGNRLRIDLPLIEAEAASRMPYVKLQFTHLVPRGSGLMDVERTYAADGGKQLSLLRHVSRIHRRHCTETLGASLPVEQPTPLDHGRFMQRVLDEIIENRLTRDRAGQHIPSFWPRRQKH